MKTIEERFWPKVDKADDCWNWTAACSGAGYGQIKDSKRVLYAHRVSYEFAYGPIPEGMMIDHACRNRRCVNPEHLRACTSKQNQENLGGPRGDTGSGVRGVYWHKQAKKWAARVGHQGRKIHIGVFDRLEDAKAASIAKRLELFTHNAVDQEADLLDDAECARLYTTTTNTLRSAA